MIWQDILMTCVNIVFIVSLVNQVVSGFKSKTSSISIYTSLPTFLGLFAMSFALYTLDLKMTSTFTAIAGILWMILFYQKIIYGKKSL